MDSLLHYLIQSLINNINFDSFAQLARAAGESFPLIRDLARADMNLLARLVLAVSAATGVGVGTVRRWFGRQPADDIPSRYLDAVIREMAKLGYPVQIIRNLVLSLFDHIKTPKRPFDRIADDAVVALGKLKSLRLNDHDGFNAEDRLVIMECASTLRSLGNETFNKILPDQSQFNFEEEDNG